MTNTLIFGLLSFRVLAAERFATMFARAQKSPFVTMIVTCPWSTFIVSCVDQLYALPFEIVKVSTEFTRRRASIGMASVAT